MQMDDATATLIAECVSRGEHLTISVLDPLVVGLWCPECRTYSAVTYPVHGLTPDGIYDLGTITACTIHDAEGRQC